MVNVVMVCVAPKVQIIYVLDVECLVTWVFWLLVGYVRYL